MFDKFCRKYTFSNRNRTYVLYERVNSYDMLCLNKFWPLKLMYKQYIYNKTKGRFITAEWCSNYFHNGCVKQTNKQKLFSLFSYLHKTDFIHTFFSFSPNEVVEHSRRRRNALFISISLCLIISPFVSNNIIRSTDIDLYVYECDDNVSSVPH